MGAVLADLSQRQLDHIRSELSVLLQAHAAYPPFFHQPTQCTRFRPVDRAKRDEIDQFVRSVDFSAIDHTDVASVEIRRFFERLIRRYMQVNQTLAGQRYARFMPSLTSRSPRLAADFQRWLIEFVAHGDGVGSVEPVRLTWSGSVRNVPREQDAKEHNTRVLAAVLVRGEGPMSGPHVAAAIHEPVPVEAVEPAGSVTMPVVTPPADPPVSPFAGLEVGVQSDVFDSLALPENFVDAPTGPLPAASVISERGSAHDLPPDLFQLYSEYLHDMQPEAITENDRREEPPAATMPLLAVNAGASASDLAPAPAAPTSEDIAQDASHTDHQIFWQLRYQLEAYIRGAARSYGLRASSDDPSGVIDALRVSGFVDEADLGIAEGILAVTDRVTSSGVVTMNDYRQALMLYLLYHRSHLAM